MVVWDREIFDASDRSSMAPILLHNPRSPEVSQANIALSSVAPTALPLDRGYEVILWKSSRCMGAHDDNYCIHRKKVVKTGTVRSLLKACRFRSQLFRHILPIVAANFAEQLGDYLHLCPRFCHCSFLQITLFRFHICTSLQQRLENHLLDRCSRFTFSKSINSNFEVSPSFPQPTLL